MPVGGTVVARNLMDGHTVLSADIKGTHSVEWGPKDDPNGDDVQYVPEAVQAAPAFQRALARGVIALIEDESDEDVVNALNRQVAAFQKRQRGAEAEAQATIDRPTNRDSLSVFCVGPDTRGTGTCDEPLPVPEAQRDKVVPLCSRHKGLAAQYVPEVKILPTGEPQTVWIRATMGTRNQLPPQQD